MTSGLGARFGHVNVTGRDWRRLAEFYRDVFDCQIVPPERDYRGPIWMPELASPGRI